MQAVDLWRIDMRSMDAEGEIKEVAKNFNLLESALISNRTITLFGEINQEVARKTAEKLLALSFESDEPITMYNTSSTANSYSWNNS